MSPRRIESGTDVMEGLIDCARKLGFLVFHVGQARKAEPGFPDLVVVGHGSLLALECKSMAEPLRPATVSPRTERLLPGQLDWLEAFSEAGVWALVVRPQATREPEWDKRVPLEISYDTARAWLQEIRDQAVL